MKTTIKSFLIVICLLLLSTNVHAGLIKPNYVYAAAGMATPSTQFVGTTRESDLNDIFNPNAPHIAVANYSTLRSNTGLGFVNGGGYNEWAQSAIKISGLFKISDLVMTYTGPGVPDPTVKTAFHLTHSSGLIAGAMNANSSLTYALTLSGHGRRSLGLSGTEINTRGVWESFFNLDLNNAFNLTFDAQMIVANSYDYVKKVYRGEGFYSAVLGGSPVFVLPKGYVVNSADGSIKNNYFVGNLGVNAIPEPSTIVLFGLAVIGILFLRSKSTKWHQC